MRLQIASGCRKNSFKARGKVKRRKPQVVSRLTPPWTINPKEAGANVKTAVAFYDN